MSAVDLGMLKAGVLIVCRPVGIHVVVALALPKGMYGGAQC